tara:strand:- start:204 stop:659 length:456 start_codon:yes stop_codon:yes gene_type:complete
MIIDCINCKKKFIVNSDLVPSSGRTIQCGSCNHIWFYQPINKTLDKKEKKTSSITKIKDKSHQSRSENITDVKKNENKKKYELTKYEKKKNLSLNSFFSYILVFLTSFVAIIILIDTFSKFLYEKFPNLEVMIFSLFETLKDVQLFIKDLV